MKVDMFRVVRREDRGNKVSYAVEELVENRFGEGSWVATGSVFKKLEDAITIAENKQELYDSKIVVKKEVVWP